MRRYDFLTEAVAGVSILLQPDEVLRIVSVILTCISVFISISFTFYKWYITIKNKKTIDENEIEELINKIDKLNDNIKGDKK